MRRLMITLAAAALVGALALPVAAGSGGVQRNQVTTNTYHLAIGNGHDWTITLCDGSVSATGSQIGGPPEDITASLTDSGTQISFKSVYVGGWGGQPYSWYGTFPVAGGTLNATDSQGGIYNGYQATPMGTSTTSYRNHGAYVAAMGGGSVAAHSCVGMPVQAHH